jgi:hypothetical protein
MLLVEMPREAQVTQRRDRPIPLPPPGFAEDLQRRGQTHEPSGPGEGSHQADHNNRRGQPQSPAVDPALGSGRARRVGIGFLPAKVVISVPEVLGGPSLLRSTGVTSEG